MNPFMNSTVNKSWNTFKDYALEDLKLAEKFEEVGGDITNVPPAFLYQSLCRHQRIERYLRCALQDYVQNEDKATYCKESFKGLDIKFETGDNFVKIEMPVTVSHKDYSMAYHMRNKVDAAMMKYKAEHPELVLRDFVTKPYFVIVTRYVHKFNHRVMDNDHVEIELIVNGVMSSMGVSDDAKSMTYISRMIEDKSREPHTEMLIVSAERKDLIAECFE